MQGFLTINTMPTFDQIVYLFFGWHVAQREGFEPSSSVVETAALPLSYRWLVPHRDHESHGLWTVPEGT